MGRRHSFIVSLVAISILGLVLSPVALATITGSQIVSPASPSFATFNLAEPNSVSIHGTTTGYLPGEEVDIDCYSLDGTEVVPLEAGVALAPNGSFQVDAANLGKIAGRLCRLRAVPAATSPTGVEAEAFAGPLLATGQKRVEAFTSGPNSGRTYGFGVESLGFGAGMAATPIGRCAARGFLIDPAGVKTTTTFTCGSRLWRFDDYDEPSNSTRSQIQVDGVDAWATSTVNEVYGGNPSHFPSIAYSSSQDPTTGDTVTHDGESFVTCTLSTCTPVGVRDERTIEVTDGAHVTTVSDRFSSSDGQTHALDLLPESIQNFGPSGSGAGAAIAYRFPGEAGYSTHVPGDEVAFAPGSPATVWVAVEGSPDGDQSTGRGAIVLDQPASPARFNYLEEGGSGFQLHETATVPASGAEEFRSAYVQAYTQSELEDLVAKVESRFAPPAPPGGEASQQQQQQQQPQPAPTVQEHAKPTVKVEKLRLNKLKGTGLLLVAVNGPGRVVLSGQGIAGAQAGSSGVGVVKLPVRLDGSALKRLRKNGRATVLAKLVFQTSNGGRAIATKRLTLRGGPSKAGGER
jgi:hypothetical protein